MTILEHGGPSRGPIIQQNQCSGVANRSEMPIEIMGEIDAMANRPGVHTDCCAALALAVLGQDAMARAAVATCEGMIGG
jgi:hypothetical protein